MKSTKCQKKSDDFQRSNTGRIEKKNSKGQKNSTTVISNIPILMIMISYEWGHCKKKEIKSKQFIKITYNMHYEKMPFNRSK